MFLTPHLQRFICWLLLLGIDLFPSRRENHIAQHAKQCCYKKLQRTSVSPPRRSSFSASDCNFLCAAAAPSINRNQRGLAALTGAIDTEVIGFFVASPDKKNEAQTRICSHSDKPPKRSEKNPSALSSSFFFFCLSRRRSDSNLLHDWRLLPSAALCFLFPRALLFLAKNAIWKRLAGMKNQSVFIKHHGARYFFTLGACVCSTRHTGAKPVA